MPFENLQPLFGDAAGSPLIIAGPCSAESRAQTLATADALAAAGVKVFRAGVWKPRTKPGGFEGMGSAALPWLAEVKERTGMLVTTEIATPGHLAETLAHGIDAVWIGARTSANPFAVQEIADALALLNNNVRARLCVMVKNPVNPDLELWIGALQRIYGAGIRRLGAIHRGFSSYGKHLYRNPPKWRIPIELHRRLPQLPLLCDPSHIGGSRELIEPLAQQALDMNFDGLIIECHCSPDSALSDAAQQITPGRLADIAGHLVVHRSSVSTENLEQLRSQIDSIDRELAELLSKRMRISRDIGQFKKEHGMPVVQSERYNDLMQRRVADAAKLDLPEEFMRNILSTIHEESVRQQIEVFKHKD